MARYEVTVESRERDGKYRKFVVDTGATESMFFGAKDAAEVAHGIAREYPDSGSVIVRKVGGGERAVIGRE